MLEDRASIKRDPESLEDWANSNLTQINSVGQMHSPHLGKKSACNDTGWQRACWGAALLKRPWCHGKH